MREASVLLVGGHSVEDSEIKYGLSVTGVIHPDKVLFNHGAVAGDSLILTKPLGTGIVSTAAKGGEINPQQLREAIDSMTRLNKKAAELIMENGCISCLHRYNRFWLFRATPAKWSKAAPLACA